MFTLENNILFTCDFRNEIEKVWYLLLAINFNRSHLTDYVKYLLAQE